MEPPNRQQAQLADRVQTSRKLRAGRAARTVPILSNRARCWNRYQGPSKKQTDLGDLAADIWITCTCFREKLGRYLANTSKPLRGLSIVMKSFFVVCVSLEILSTPAPLQPLWGVGNGATCVENDVHEAFQSNQLLQVPTLALQFVIKHVSLPQGPLKATEKHPVCAAVRCRDTAVRDLFDEKTQVASCSEARSYALLMRVSEKAGDLLLTRAAWISRRCDGMRSSAGRQAWCTITLLAARQVRDVRACEKRWCAVAL